MKVRKPVQLRVIGAVALSAWGAAAYAFYQMTAFDSVGHVRQWALAVACGVVAAAAFTLVWLGGSVVDWTLRRRAQLAPGAQPFAGWAGAQLHGPVRPVPSTDWPGPVLVPSGGECDVCHEQTAEHFCMAHGCALCAECVRTYTCPGTGCEWRTRAATAPTPGRTSRRSSVGGNQ